MLLCHLCNDLELILRLQLGTSRTDDIKTARIPVCIYILIIELYKVILYKTAGTALETKQNIIPVGSLDRIIQTAYHVVSAWCLTA